MPLASISTEGWNLVVRVKVPPVTYTWYEYDKHTQRWEPYRAQVSDPIVLESIELAAYALAAPDVVIPLCLPENCYAERHTDADGTFWLRLVVNLSTDPLLDARHRWRLIFRARTAGTTWRDAHTDPREVYAEAILTF